MMGVVASGQWSVVSRKDAQAAASSRLFNPHPFLSNPQPPTPNHQSAASRRGITLLEVLISMFVLLIGLMGVGAMIPAGRHEIMQGVKTDYATTVGRAAFRALKARGYLNPRSWARGVAVVYSRNTGITANQPFDSSVGGTVLPAVAIDPLGITATPPFVNVFPAAGSTKPLARLNLFQVPEPTFSPMTKTVADSMFRCTDDLVTLPSLAGRDNPPVQSSVPFNPNPLIPINPIMSRSSEGNYSWLATIVTNPTPNAIDATIKPTSALASKVTVSVAVFYKRDLSAAKEISVPCGVFVGSELRIDLSTAAQFPDGVRPGQWIMVAGTITVANPDVITLGAPPFIQATTCRWYRVLGAAKRNGNFQDITLAGEWSSAIPPTEAWLFDGVIAVFEKNMQLEIE